MYFFNNLKENRFFLKNVTFQNSRTVASLPLKEDKDRPRIDFVVFLISMIVKK